MSSQAKPYAIAANGKVNLSGGTAFALLSAEAVVNVTVWAGGVIAGYFEGILGGLNWKYRNKSGDLVSFDFVEISSVTAQTVIAFSGEGDVEYSRSQGDVNVLSVARNSPVWQGRNPLKVGLSSQFDTIAPHALTDRIVYTVPVGRQCVVGSFTLDIFRVTAAGTPGLWGALAHAGNVVFVDIRTRKNAVEDRLGVVSSSEIWLAAGQTCVGRTQDGSTGGTLAFAIAMSGIEFDA